MGLFFDVLSAINNPNQQGSVDQLGAIVNTVQQLAPGVDASTKQTAMSALTGILRSTLKQQASTGGASALEGMLGQLTGGGSAAAMLPSFLNNTQMQQQLAQVVAQKTGLNAGMVQTMLPGLLTAALSFLKIGAGKSGTGAPNTVLDTFLNSDRDGSVDLGDAFKFANRFFNPPAQLAQ